MLCTELRPFSFCSSSHLISNSSKSECLLDFLRNRRQLRNNAQKIIFDFLFTWLTAHQKIIRADMEDAGKAKRSCCGYQELTNLQNIQACLDAVCRVAHESEIGFLQWS